VRRWIQNVLIVLIVLIGLGMVAVPILFRAWRGAVDRSLQAQAVDPFRIADNFYYIGKNDNSDFLVSGPEGHVLLYGGDSPAPFILASIAKLGFDIKDVRVLLDTDPHEAGALAELQQASGAQLWVSNAGANIVAAGGEDPDVALPYRTLVRIGVASYKAPRVDHRFNDGDTIRVGPIALTAHITGGRSRGCTSWSFPVRDGGRVLNVVSACSLIREQGVAYPEQDADLERSFEVLRKLPVDIWVTSRSRLWGRYRKFTASGTAKNPVDPFIDPAGYRAYIDTAEGQLRGGIFD
jgi:metallo-beta-lactamase class B